MTPTLILAACGLAFGLAGCATRPRAVNVWTHGPCTPADPGTPEVSRRLATLPDTSLRARGLGALHVAVSGTGRDTLTARVDLFRGDTAQPDAHLLTVTTDSLGRWESRALPGGTVRVEAIAIPYERHGGAIAIRAGFRDTIAIRLRLAVTCPT